MAAGDRKGPGTRTLMERLRTLEEQEAQRRFDTVEEEIAHLRKNLIPKLFDELDTVDREVVAMKAREEVREQQRSSDRNQVAAGSGGAIVLFELLRIAYASLGG